MKWERNASRTTGWKNAGGSPVTTSEFVRCIEGTRGGVGGTEIEREGADMIKIFFRRCRGREWRKGQTMGDLSEVVSDYIFFHFIHPRDYFTATP